MPKIIATDRQIHKGRGASSNPPGRFEKTTLEPFQDDWETDVGLPRAPETELRIDHSKTIISTNQSEDIPFEQSINPYKGCEHGCSYCYARQTHAYLDLSPGLDFETKIYYKPRARALLEKALAAPGYQCKLIAMGTNTDPYQPAERDLRLTRSILELLLQCRHPVAIVTKGALIERDLDILSEMAAMGLAHAAISLTTADASLKRLMEPRAASPRRRLQTIARLRAAGVPVGAMIAPVIPGLTDHEMESLMEEAQAAGAGFLSYVLLRLPFEVNDVFQAWLQDHFPQRAEHIMSLVRQTRGGKDYDSSFGQRQQGTGLIAELIAQRFQIKRRRLGLGRSQTPLRTDLFRSPLGEQLALF